MMVDRHKYVLKENNEENLNGYLGSKNYTVYWSSNDMNKRIDNLKDNLVDANTKLGKLFQYDASNPNINLVSYGNQSDLEDKLKKCSEDHSSLCSDVLFGLYVKYDPNVNRKNYTIYLLDKGKKKDAYLLGNIKYATTLSLLQKTSTTRNFPYIFIYDSSNRKSLSNDFTKSIEYFLSMNHYYQLFSIIFIVAAVNNIVNQRNGLLKKYLHNIGVSRFVFYSSSIFGPLVEMIIFFTISGAILLYWCIPDINMSLLHFIIWKILYSICGMGFGIILTSLCKGKKDVLMTIIFWIVFIHLDIGQTVGLTSDSILAVLNINIIDSNLARIKIDSLYKESNVKKESFPLEIIYKNEFSGTFGCQLIYLIINMLIGYGFGIIVDKLWPNDSYNQFSFLYYIRRFRNYTYIRHILDKDDFHDLNKAIEGSDSKRKNIVKKEKKKSGKYKKNTIVGEHISKIYKATGETALEDVSFEFKSKQINVIIGFNESGLTTLTEILAGASGPSKGHIKYFKKSLKKFGRHKIGYCPHFTVTYTGMTVEMALKVFSIIKTNKYQRLNTIKKEHLFINEDVELLIDTLGLTDYMDIYCEHLPERVQMYLNLCMAFVGDPKIVILNGVLDKLPNEDVVKIIGILKDIKEDKTIIISTQDMEIVDQLADHVLLLKRGKVVDEGPFQKLKKIHCSYAKLDIRLKRSLIGDEKNLNIVFNTIHNFVKHFVADAVIEDTQSYSNHLVLRLPQRMKSNFGRLLDCLENQTKEFNIIDFSIHSYSLEDSFLLSNIGATLEPRLQKSIDLINKVPGFDDRASGFELYTKQLFALIKKRFSYMFIDVKTLLFVIITGVLLTSALPQYLRNYSLTFCSLNGNTALEKSFIPLFSIKNNSDDLHHFRDNMKHLDRKGSNRKQIGKFSMKPQEIPQNYIFWGPKYPIKVSPKISNFQSIITTNICLNLSLSLMDSLINSYINENYDDIESQVIYFKSNVKHSHNNTLGIFNTDESIVNFFGKKNGINWNVFIPTAQIIIMCIATYFLTIYPLFIERIKGFKQQQYYAGVSPFLYWISNFIADTIIGIIVFSSLIVLFGFLNEDANFLPFFQATCIYFFMNLPIFYCLTFFGKYFSNTCGFLGIIFLTLQGLMCIVFEKNNITENEYNEKNKSYVWKIIKTYMNPFTILYKIQIARYYGNENDKKNANYLMNLPIGLPITIVYILILFSFLILIECGVLISIRNWIGTVRSIINESNNTKSRRRRQTFDSKTTTEEDINNNLDESCFISTIRPNDEPTIIMEHAKPYLRDVNLQRGLNFDVFPGECYCWYIKDDRERESIFNFMTGNIKKKEGSITIYDRDVNTRMRMGYSPSKNAILPFFTPFEHYKFFALLSGFRKSKLQSINMLNLTGLIQCRHKQLQYCDSNQKRRLVVGISALTQSGALFLDTPTEYLYKQGRNEIWELISILLVEKEESIVITTNNLEECNELSSRFGYINNGYVEYNGTYTGLKEIYCDGYNFKITVSNPSLEVLICLDQIMVSELDAIPGDLTKITSLMEWDVPKATKSGKVLSWSDVYSFGEQLFLRYGKLIVQPINCNDNVNDVNNLTKTDTTSITINTTSSTIGTKVDDDSDEDEEDEDDNKTEDEGDNVSGYCGIRSSLTVPHIIDYVVTNNSLEQIIFKIQNSNL